MPLKQNAPRASFKPENASGGSRVPDGEYKIAEARTGLNTYNGTVPEGVPAIIFVLSGENGDYENAWKAGDNQHLVPTEDGLGFVHPDGKSSPTIFKDGAANYLLKSFEAAGFEVGDPPEGIKQFEGVTIRLKSQMIKLGQDKKDTPTPLVDKIISRPGQKPTGKLSSAKAQDNGDLEKIAVELVTEVLSRAAGKTKTIENLSMGVWMAAGKDGSPHKAQRQNLRDFVTVDWIKTRREFETDGETVGLA